MGSLFGRKDRERTSKRRGQVAKKSASLLAAVAVAGGSVTVGVPEAEAATFSSYIYWEKTDRAGKPLDGSMWIIEPRGELEEVLEERSGNYQLEEDYGTPPFGFGVIDNVVVGEDANLDDVRKMEDNPTDYYLLSDLDPRPGHFLVEDPIDAYLYLYNPRWDYKGEWPRLPVYKEYKLKERKSPAGYWLCEDVEERIDFMVPSPGGPYETVQMEDGRFKHTLRERAQLTVTNYGEGWGEVKDKNFLPGAGAAWHREIGHRKTTPPEGLTTKEILYDSMGRLPKEVINDEEKPNVTQLYENVTEKEDPLVGFTPIYSVGSVANCRIDGSDEPSEDPTPTPSVTTETTTVTQPVTTTVTPPVTTVTLPSTVTTTVTPPVTTVTEPPKTETTTATTTESATTTVTEPAKTETVTETPQRETVTETPTPKTETVTETPQKETVTETPKAETVTETPKKETVTETPKAFTETKTSTVTAPQVTLTETPKQVTETTTLPQKTVTQQVPTTVVKDQTETVKMPPVTVTETERQEPVTVSALPQTVTETVKVPGENTTVVVTEPGEPTTVRETVTEETTSVVPVVVDNPKPSAPAPAPAPVLEQPVEAPVEVKQEPANGVRRVLATTGAETNLLLGLGAGVLAMLALVAIVRRKKA